MIILQVFIGLLTAGWNIGWIRTAKKDNGDFDKKEIVQWLLGNLFIGLFYCHSVLNIVFSEWHWGIIAVSLIGSVGIQLYFEKPKN